MLISRLVVTYSLFSLVKVVSNECFPEVCHHWRFHPCPTYNCENSNLSSVPSYENAIKNNVASLLLTSNIIQTLNDNSFRRWQSLRHLDFSHNKIRIITPLAFKPLTNLEWLNLDGNLITLSDEPTKRPFSYLPQLKFLKLSRNPLGQIPNYYLIKCKTIDELKLGNSIGGLKLNEYSFFGLKSISFLYLTGNHLQTLPEKGMKESLDGMKNLGGVYLGGQNNWTCDCRLRWIKTWKLNIKLRGLRCHSPPKLKSKSILDPMVKASDFGCQPEIHSRSANITADSGDHVTLTCNISSDPLGYVIWTKNGNRLKNGSKLSIYTSAADGIHLKSVLVIGLVNSSDTGEWVCIVNNTFGSAMVSFNIEVESSKSSTSLIPRVSFVAVLLVLFLSIVTILLKNKNRIIALCFSRFRNQFRFRMFS